MSRSYRKPGIVQEKQDMKYWNRKFRHNKLERIPNGCYYKKAVGRWNFKYLWTEQDARELYRNICHLKYSHTSRFESEEDYINWYRKEYLRK